MPFRREKLPLGLFPFGPQSYNWLALPHASLTTPRPFRKRGNEAALCGQGGCQQSAPPSTVAHVPSEDTRKGPERHSNRPVSQPQPLQESPALSQN